jgi:hypothetical protein
LSGGEEVEGGSHGREGDSVAVDFGGMEPGDISDIVEALGLGVVGELTGEEEVDNGLGDVVVVVVIDQGAEVVELSDVEADFFFDFADESGFGVFVVVSKAAGQAEFPFGGFFGADDE